MIKKTIEEVTKKIWDYAELRFEEYKSMNELADYAEKAGFKVEKGIGGLETAFKATYGDGKPVIAILGEYDALQGLSQKADTPIKTPGEQKNTGHGCGHHLLGAGALYGAEIAKNYLEKNNLKGTIVYYGCPAEEGGSGKTWMVKNGAFDGVDVALTWHPFPYNGVFSLTTLANYQVYFKFEGKGSHAAASPQLGRSALDAVELMNVGVNYLREHVIQEARFHYAVTNTGGVSPNVVQPEAEVLYLIRAPKLSQVEEIFQRICNIARGAALMTETKVTMTFDKGTSEYVGNKTIEKTMYKNLKKFENIEYTEEEKAYAKKFKDTLSENDITSEFGWIGKASGKEWKGIKEMMLNDYIFKGNIPYNENFEYLLSGSTDVGDISKKMPTGQIFTACYALGTPSHSWQMVAQGKSSIAMKGMKYAGQVLGQSAIDILENPELLAEIKNEFNEEHSEYVSPLKYERKPIKL